MVSHLKHIRINILDRQFLHIRKCIIASATASNYCRLSDVRFPFGFSEFGERKCVVTLIRRNDMLRKNFNALCCAVLDKHCIKQR